MKTLLAYLRLMRPANIVTAVADIMLGFAVSGWLIWQPEQAWWAYKWMNAEALGWLVLSTVGLYGGGVVLNDVLDYKLDQVERPERPLPSGAASLSGAITLGSLLLLGGIIAANQVNIWSAMIAFAISVLVIIYDSTAKHHVFFGPLTMGSCRGANLLLGISASPEMLNEWWGMALIPLIYIAAITLISQGEVHGGNITALRLAVLMYGLVVSAILYLSFLNPYSFWMILPFLGLLSYLIFPPLLAAMQDLQAPKVFKAVKAGVLALIVLDASLSVSFAGWPYGILVLLLLPLSLGLAKLFAVT